MAGLGEACVLKFTVLHTIVTNTLFIYTHLLIYSCWLISNTVSPKVDVFLSFYYFFLHYFVFLSIGILTLYNVNVLLALGSLVIASGLFSSLSFDK